MVLPPSQLSFPDVAGVLLVIFPFAPLPLGSPVTEPFIVLAPSWVSSPRVVDNVANLLSVILSFALLS